jgi:HEAT repeat protein
MGSDGIAVLTEAVTNSDPNLRLNAATALGEARSDFDKVIPALIESAQLGGHQPLEDNLARSAAADTLVALHKEPNLVVPMFAGFLTKQDEYIRNLGVKNVLVGFGADARIAIPQLLQAETNSDPNVRESATNVIKEINSSEEKTRDEAQAGP